MGSDIRCRDVVSVVVDNLALGNRDEDNFSNTKSFRSRPASNR
jgi:hypothetical protein